MQASALKGIVVATAVLLGGCGGSVCIEGLPCGGSLPSYAEPEPAAVAGTQRFAATGIGNWHSCLLDVEGGAWCAGANDGGQLGAVSSERCMSDTIDCASSLQPVGGGHRFTALASGQLHSCALDADGAAWCWGFGLGGQLGDGLRSSSLAPVAVAGNLRFVRLTVSLWGSVSCGVTAGGEAWCWGIDGMGPAGPTASAVPARWAAAAAVRVRELTLGEAHACAVDHEGALWCWGRNSFGELGSGLDTSSAVPIAIAPAQRFRQVTAGPMHTCALDTTGTAWCWGFAAAGDGIPGGEVRRSPAAVGGNHGFTQVAAGQQRTCALDTAAAAWCWGDNSLGGLGDGSLVDRAWPTAVSGGLHWQRLGLGGMASCGITVDGTAQCWGWNETGALGRPIVAH